MNGEIVISLFLTFILMAVGLVALIQVVNHIAGRSLYVSSNILIIDIVTGIIYILAWSLIGLMYIYSGYDMLVVFASLGIGVLAAVILFVRFCIQHQDTMNMNKTWIFLAYFAFVLFLTIFMRIGRSDIHGSVAPKPFDDLSQAISSGNPALVWHMLQNILLFIPFGYLIPEMNPRYLRKWSFAMLGGLMVSTTIEMVQLVFGLGQSDIDDIIANTIGAVLGYLLIRFIWRYGDDLSL